MLIHVRVQPDSKKDGIIEKNDTSYIVSVKESAEKNQANTKMLSLLAAHLKIPRNRLCIITGHHAPGKIVEILAGH